MSRRSVRQFTGETVSEEDVDTMLRAAMQAPSASNGQPWHFVVIQDRTLLNRIAAVHPYAGMCKEAPLALLVCARKADSNSPDYWMLDCSTATQNLLLAAHASGLGAVWVSVYPNPDRAAALASVCSLPQDVHPVALVPIGHPRERPAAEVRFKPERIHRDRW
jgi:nitroreductase